MELCAAKSSRLTAVYHRTILGITEDFRHEVAWCVSQKILDRLWDEDGATSAGECEKASQNARPAFINASAENSPVRILLCCQGCGFRLHPGWGGTTLRIQRPKIPCSSSAKKTLRRREQRRRRNATRAEESRSKDHNRRRFLAVAPSSTVESTSLEIGVILRDDSSISRLDRNHLVLTCGNCQHKTYLKGLRRELENAHAGFAKSALQSSVATQSQKGPGKATAAACVRPHDLGQSFELVPKLERKPSACIASASKTSRISAKATSSTLSLLEQKGGRKKKRKKSGSNPTNQKSGNLLSFLSSLNDH